MRRALALIACAAGCTVPGELRVVDPALPAGAAWIGVLAIDSNGDLVGSTGLVRRETGIPVWLLSDGESAPAALEIVAYTEPEIGALAAGITDDLIFRGRLVEATEDDPLLPATTYARRFSVEDGRATNPTAAPARELTAAWLPPCPNLITTGTTAIDLSCVVIPCGNTVTQELCRLEIDARLCAGGEISGIVGPRGSITWERADLGVCTSVEPPPPEAILATTCVTTAASCDIRLYAPNDARRLAFTKTTIGPTERDGDYGLYRPVDGYITGLAVLDDVIVAVRHAAFPRHWFNCFPGVPSDLVFLDPETLTVRGSTSAPDCLQLITRDPKPNTRGFIGVFGGGERWIGRFDENGRLLERAQIARPETSTVAHVAHLEIHQDPPVISVLISDEEADGPAETEPRLATIDRDDFHLLRLGPPMPTPMHPNNVVIASGEIDNRRIATLDNGKPELFRTYDLTTLEETSNTSLWDLCSSGHRIATSAIYFHRPTGLILLPASSNDAQTMFIFPPNLATCERANAIEIAGEAFAALTWPNDDSLVLVNLSEDRPAMQSYLVLFEPRERRFLPGDTHVGVGPAAFMTADRRGRIWFALPWESGIVRVDGFKSPGGRAR